ncbi:peptide deformylase [Rothia nasimurium]|uniref:peptide deformylase n=1 Tax=Rothia nasimurium TaxID=85336 RepID=UPI003BA23485
MTILTIRTVGDPVLRTECDPITVFDAELEKLVADMLETMYEVEGVGLAGPQVGISKQIFTFGNIEGFDEGHIINPVLEVGDEPQEGGEGCLSVPGLSAATPRKNWARVTGVNCKGEPVVYEGEGLFARMLQHETDHLHGTMYIDRVEGEDKKNIWRAIRQANYNQVAAAVQGDRAAATSSSFGALGGSFGAGTATGQKPGSFGF